MKNFVVISRIKAKTNDKFRYSMELDSIIKVGSLYGLEISSRFGRKISSLVILWSLRLQILKTVVLLRLKAWTEKQISS
jgi:hypothetical protein